MTSETCETVTVLTCLRNHDRDRRLNPVKRTHQSFLSADDSVAISTCTHDDRHQIRNSHHPIDGMQLMRATTLALTAGLGLMLIAIVLVLGSSPLTVTGTNSVSENVSGELTKGNVSSCQPAAIIPRGTSAIRLSIEPIDVGPEVSVKVLTGSRILTSGRRPAGWGSASTVTVPVKPIAHAVYGARICTTVGTTGQPFRISGKLRGSRKSEVELQALILRAEYLRPGPKSWFSLIPSVAYHMGLGRAASGTWIVFLALALILAVAILASGLVLKELP
jgi:hypothetical protein